MKHVTSQLVPLILLIPVALLPQAQSNQTGFDTPQAAAQALVAAARVFDVKALQQILGPHSEELIASEDPVRDKNWAIEFAVKAGDKMSVQVNPKNPAEATLAVGDEDWPLPIPIVSRQGKWYFDTAAGRQEILRRRVGANELDAITVCRDFVDAQKEYAVDSEDHQYAQRFISTPGKRDGLYWIDRDGKPGGPLSEEVAKAIEEGYTPSKSSPFHGYYFKVLKGQGPAAHLGQLNFLINGAMIGGFALVAVPAEYRVTGVKTFLVSHEGTVYEKDLGPDSLKIVERMDTYNPDKSWRPTKASW
jgi:hypothetical protein